LSPCSSSHSAPAMAPSIPAPDAPAAVEKGRVQLSEWHTLAVALLGALVTGFIYGYSTYSNALQAAFNLSESDKESIGIAPIISNLITFTNGLLMDRTSVWFCCLLGGIIMFTSNALSGAIALKYIVVSNPVPWFFLFGALMNYGAGFMVAATFTVLTKNFSGERRSALVGIAKSWVGASSGVGTAMFIGLFPCGGLSSERLGFLWFLAVLTGGIPVCVAPFLRPLAPDRLQLPDNLRMPLSWRLPFLFALSLVLIATTLLASFIEGAEKGHDRAVGVAFSVALLCILVMPFIMLIPRRAAGADADGSLMQIEDAEQSLEQQAVLTRSRSPWEGGPGYMARCLSFYLIWFCSFALQSGGLFLVSNMGSMVESRSGPAVPSSTLVTVFSCSQGLARLITGSISNELLRRRLPRTLYFVSMTALMAAAHAILCVPRSGSLLLGTILAGWAFGSSYPLNVLIIGEVFGPDRFASNYMIIDGTPGACGSLIFAKLLAESVYNAHAGPDGKCHGDECFRLAHAVIAGAQLVACVLGTFLSFRVRPVYRTICQQLA